MTGFGLGDASLTDGRVVAEIRSVNQRFLDVRARLPRELVDLTMFAEQVARERLRRGRIEIIVRTEGAVLAPSTLDKSKARAAFRALAELRDELAPGADVPLSLLCVVPDLFAPAGGHEIAVVRAALKLAIERAIDAMEGMCLREGEALASDMRGRVATLRTLASEVVARADDAREALRRRLRERVERLLQGVEAGFEATRIEAEVMLLAERSDITEEVTRLRSHLDQFGGALSAPSGDPCGRRLDFLLQEMVREANTLGSKAQDAAISHHVVAMKVELERLREQVQNIE
ncbi:YicC/YloC family endoribonuclease [Sorangium sp. So ce1000]|uniref:YicC/YloC family endoribonuclease n=1 Tax=Sorangium sp. So ce1000 TaxID=3133325 RepID=UPI003F5F07ED